MGQSGEVAQATPEKLWIYVFEQRGNIAVGTLPDRHRRSKQRFALCGQAEKSAASVGSAFGDRDQASSLERFEGSGEGGAIHGEQSRDGCDAWRLGTIEGH